MLLCFPNNYFFWHEYVIRKVVLVIIINNATLISNQSQIINSWLTCRKLQHLHQCTYNFDSWLHQSKCLHVWYGTFVLFCLSLSFLGFQEFCNLDVWAALKNVGLPSNNKFTSKLALRLFHSRFNSDLRVQYGISWQHFNAATHHWTTPFWLCPARFALIGDRCYGVTL